ncbi:MAG: hypothetical protein HC904_11840 [Blastochloris sp.]|nr:hypothetical protein [Blastochloris sp.]
MVLTVSNPTPTQIESILIDAELRLEPDSQGNAGTLLVMNKSGSILNYQGQNPGEMLVNPTGDIVLVAKNDIGARSSRIMIHAARLAAFTYDEEAGGNIYVTEVDDLEVARLALPLDEMDEVIEEAYAAAFGSDGDALRTWIEGMRTVKGDIDLQLLGEDARCWWAVRLRGWMGTSPSRQMKWIW